MEHKTLAARDTNVRPREQDDLEEAGASSAKVAKLDISASDDPTANKEASEEAAGASSAKVEKLRISASDDWAADWEAFLPLLRVFGKGCLNLVLYEHLKLHPEHTRFMEDKALNKKDSRLRECLRSSPSLCQTPMGFLLTGGLNTRQCFHFDKRLKEWKELPQLNVCRFSHLSFAIGSEYFVAGGKSYFEPVEHSLYYHTTIEYLNRNGLTAEWQLLAPEGTEGKCLPENWDTLGSCVAGDAAYIFDYNTCSLLQFRDQQLTRLSNAPFAPPVSNPLKRLSVMAALGKTLYVANTDVSYEFCTESSTWSYLPGPGLRYQHTQPAVLSLQEQKTIVVLAGEHSYGNECGCEKVERWTVGDTAWTDCEIRAPLKLPFIAYVGIEEWLRNL